MKPNIKTFDDLVRDTENTWECEDSLEELLFDSDELLAEAVGKPVTLTKGDIIMADSGWSSREGGMRIQAPHRIYLIERAKGPIGNRTFKGYLLSSKVAKANYFNKRFPHNIYIEDYGTILAAGPVAHKQAFINLGDLYTIKESKLSQTGGLWKGKASQEFIDFIDDAISKLEADEYIGDKYWLTQEDL